MASSSKPTGPYEVFLSFRGTDVRNSFASHLYNALVQNGIHTFRDNEELKKGQDLSMLLKAIEDSPIAIIVFSEDYASSWWCLEEVAKIIELKDQKDLIVLPVFYKVDPREVRGGSTSYARGLAKHESKHGKDSKEMKRWKKALRDAGSLSGWTLNDGDDEWKLIQDIVKDISTRLCQIPLDVAQHPVGIESRVAKLKSILNLESKDDVLMVGLWGQGGIGKTTLGRAIYNDIFRLFDGSSFLVNVRERSKDCMGLAALQGQLLNDILLPTKELVVFDVARGKSLIPLRLHDKRVLVILDDVDDLDQLRALAGKANWFGHGSRILITTRDRHLLAPTIDRDLVYVHEVKALKGGEARALLSKHAFSTYEKLKSRTDLLNGFLNHAEGLPLALEVLGSLLCDTTEDVWENILEKLSMSPNEKINNVLKVSYDGLEENEQEIFLHIACFFKWQEREYAKKVLDSCDLQTTAGFDILIKRCLIRIESEKLQMHDLIQSMGRNIVNHGYRDDPEKRSRLWFYDDVRNVLQHNTGDCNVKAIVLEPREPIEIYIGPDAFTKMRKLRLLILRNVHNSVQDPVCFPSRLRWFEWPGYPHIPEFSFGSKELVGLDLSKTNITVVPEQFKSFQRLKYMNFSYCEWLVRMPDLSCIPNLEELHLQNCKNLVEAHESIAYHDKLQVLDLRECSELSVFPNVLKSKNLRALNLTLCKKFEKFPDIPHELQGLEKIYLHGTAIKGLPASIENLVSLEEMYLSYCRNLVSLPSNIYKLPNVEILELDGCTNLIVLPKYEDSTDLRMKTGFSNLRELSLERCNLFDTEFLDDLSCFPLLSRLHMRGNNFTSLPKSFSKRDHLSFLDVVNCRQLQEIPELPPFLDGLWAGGCESLQNYGDLTSVHYFVHRALNMADISSRGQDPSYSIILPGGEMPEWIHPVEEGSISFMVSEDLYDKFLGFALFVSCGSDGHNAHHSYQVVGRVNGKEMTDVHYCISDGLDNVGLMYLIPSQCWGAVDFSRIDGSHAQFSLEVSGKTVKKWGIRIICEQLDDDLTAVLNRLMDPALIYEIRRESTDSESESSDMHKDCSIEMDVQRNSEDCVMSTEQHSQIVSKRNQKLILPQGKKPRQC